MQFFLIYLTPSIVIDLIVIGLYWPTTPSRNARLLRARDRQSVRTKLEWRLMKIFNAKTSRKIPPDKVELYPSWAYGAEAGSIGALVVQFHHWVALLLAAVVAGILRSEIASRLNQNLQIQIGNVPDSGRGLTFDNGSE